MADQASGCAPKGSHRVYRAFGFSIDSAIILPDLREISGGGRCDVRLQYGPANPGAAGRIEAEPFIDTHGSVCLVRTPAGRLLVADGALIEIDPAPDATEADLGPYVLGSALAILCHQRGLLPLHASAVAARGGAVAFLGESGAGKSTLAAGLSSAGYPVLCDDLCAVDFQGGYPVVLPGVTRLKLWPDSLALVGAEPGDLDPIGPLGKFSLPTWGEGAAGRRVATPLLGLYSLRTTRDGGPLRRLRGLEAVAAILAAVHRWPTAIALGLSRRVFEQVVDLARAASILDAPDTLDPDRPSSRLETIMASFDRIV